MIKKNIFLTDTYFKVDLTIGYTYVIEVVGTTTKGSETNKVSKTFTLVSLLFDTDELYKNFLHIFYCFSFN